MACRNSGSCRTYTYTFLEPNTSYIIKTDYRLLLIEYLQNFYADTSRFNNESLFGSISFMKVINWDIKPQVQPTSTTCGQTALSILLAHYGDVIDPLEIEARVPQCVNEKGEKVGTINQQLAIWCLGRGYDATMYTFDCQIIDQSWSELDNSKLKDRLELRKSGWVVPAMGKEWTEQYAQSYIDFIDAGGRLYIQQAATTKLLYELLENGPLLLIVSYSSLYGAARTRVDNENESPNDDINGRALNHSIVLYGIDENGNFKIADPARSERPSLALIEPEIMLAAIATAQIECDNLLFQLKPRA